MVEIEDQLMKLGHEVVLPDFTHEFAEKGIDDHIGDESAKNKIEHDLIRGYFEIIKQGDALLAINEDKKGIKNYIGGNTFLEMSFAHVLNKPVYLLNPIPEVSYVDEIIAMGPIVLDNDLSKI
jgi:hypothetical protein